MNKKELAEKIRSKRAAKGLKQEDVADRLDIAIGTYSNIERGKTDITVTRLYEIADILEENIFNFLLPNNVSANIQEPAINQYKSVVDESFKEEIRKLIREEMAKSNTQNTNPKEAQKPKRRK